MKCSKVNLLAAITGQIRVAEVVPRGVTMTLNSCIACMNELIIHTIYINLFYT